MNIEMINENFGSISESALDFHLNDKNLRIFISIDSIPCLSSSEVEVLNIKDAL